MSLVTGPSVPDRTGPSFVVGVDEDGGLVEGLTLYQGVAGGLPPTELARRAFDILLARADRSPLDPATDTSHSFFRAEAWALVAPPSVDGGVLTLWYVEGEMHPEITRGQLALATGAFDRKAASQIISEAAKPRRACSQGPLDRERVALSGRSSDPARQVPAVEPASARIALRYATSGAALTAAQGRRAMRHSAENVTRVVWLAAVSANPTRLPSGLASGA